MSLFKDVQVLILNLTGGTCGSVRLNWAFDKFIRKFLGTDILLGILQDLGFPTTHQTCREYVYNLAVAEFELRKQDFEGRDVKLHLGIKKMSRTGPLDVPIRIPG